MLYALISWKAFGLRKYAPGNMNRFSFSQGLSSVLVKRLQDDVILLKQATSDSAGMLCFPLSEL